MPLVSLLFHDVYVTDPRESGFVTPAADRYKLTLEEFEGQVACLQGAFDFRITVDDGGVSFYTVLADRFEALGWRAHCFVTTDCIGERGFLTAPQIRELDARGHIIGTHSASHPMRFSTLPPERMEREWVSSRQLLEHILGHSVTTASVPGGYYSREVALAACDAGISTLFTSEPITALRHVNGCTVAGRFALRRGHPPDTAARLVGALPWARWNEWARWNAKGVVKPVLGPSYARVAGWVLREG
jgi:peptidoglycan/xylan/chitin deacetylase (PgdA/CDA1 family)